MKKSIIAAALVGTMLLSGCSGVSEESYNSVVAENTKLQSEKSSLESEKSKIEGEKADLQAKVAELEQQNNDNAALIEELEKDNVPLEVVDLLLKTLAHSENEIFNSQYADNLQQYVYTDLSGCHIYNIPANLPASSIASTLKGQESTLDDFRSSGISSYVFLFKSYVKENICCYWTDGKQSGWVWFDADVKAEFDKL